VNREITDIMGNKDHPYNKPNHPSHKNAVEEMALRFKALAGG
jgi:hypothetical protein